MNVAPLKTNEPRSFSDITEDDYALIYGPAPRLGAGANFPRNATIPAHSHGADQLLYPGSGVLTVSTDQGAWVVPPERAVWIPAGTVHSVKMVVPVTNRSLFVDSKIRVREARQCEVITIKPLLHNLIMEAFEAKDEPNTIRNRLLLAMILTEIRLAATLPISLSFPKTAALTRLCEAYIANPTAQETIDVWSNRLGMSRRAFTRQFRNETGLSFTEWRQQACLFAALPRLSSGESVTTVSIDLGYSSPSAFTTMFKRAMGISPRRYLG